MAAGRPRSVSDADIFEAVARVVTERGPDGLTLSAVAGEIGLTPSALTHRFGSKRSLLLAFVEHQAGLAPRLIESARARTADPAGAAREVLLDLAGGMTTRAQVANGLAFLQRDLTDPAFGRHAAAHSRAIRHGLVALVDEACPAGDTPSRVIADDLYTAASGALLTWAVDGDGPLIDWLAERIDRVMARYGLAPG